MHYCTLFTHMRTFSTLTWFSIIRVSVGGPTSPPLQYHQPRCPVDLNFDHLPHYIDQHHFVHQQHNVQPPIGILEVDMTFDEKAQCIRVVKEYNIINHFNCRTIYSDQRRLNFVSYMKMVVHGAWAHAIQRGITNGISRVSEVITLVS